MMIKEGKGKETAAFFVSALGMLLLIFAMLLTAFQLAIYGDPEYRFYEKEYTKYHVTDALNMELKEEELSIVIKVDGRTQDFFNEQDRFHMGEVKDLFLGGLKLRNICLLLVFLIMMGLIVLKMDWRRLVPKAFFRVLILLTVLGVLLGIAFTVDFTRCFTIFHEIFFDNDLWMFNPGEDYMIRMLPEGFFSDMVVRIGTTFIGMMAALSGALIIVRK